MIANVLVSLRHGVFYVDSYDETTKGLWISGGNPIAVPEVDGAGALGSAVREAIDQSRHDVAAQSPNTYTDALVKLAGVGSHSTFRRGLKEVGVDVTERDGDRIMIRIVPMKRATDGGPPEYDPENAHTLSYDSPGQLGVALLDAFKITVGT